MRNELPPISDWPHARGGTGTTVSPVTTGNASQPPTPANPGAGGLTGGATTATPPLSQTPPLGGLSSLDAGSAASPLPAADAGLGLGSQDAGASADSAVDAGAALGTSDAGCSVPLVQDAGACIGFGCRLTRDLCHETVTPGLSQCTAPAAP